MTPEQLRDIKAAVQQLVSREFSEVAALRAEMHELREEVRQMRRFAEAWSLQGRIDRLEEAAGFRVKR